MFRYLWLQSIREKKSLLKHYFPVVIALLLGFAFGYDYYVQKAGTTLEFLLQNRGALLGYAALAILFYLFLSKQMVFYVHPATIHNLHTTKLWRRVWTLAIACKLAANLAVSLFSVAPVLWHSSLPSQAFWILAVWMFLSVIVLAKWMLYIRKHRLFALVLLSFCSLCLSAAILDFPLWKHGIVRLSLSAAFVLAFVSLLAVAITAKFEIGRYYESALRKWEIDKAVFQRDLAEMQRMQAEFSANSKRRFRLDRIRLTRRNALFFKALTETIAMSRGVFLIIAFMSVLAVLSAKVDGLPILSNPGMRQYFSVFVLATSVSNLGELFVKQFKGIMKKHREGFFIPYPRREIIRSYAAIGMMVVGVYVLVMGFVLSSGWALLVSLPMFLLLFLAQLYLPNCLINNRIAALTVFALHLVSAAVMIPF